MGFILFLFTVFTGITVHATETQNSDGNLIKGAVSGILVEQSTGEILYLSLIHI